MGRTGSLRGSAAGAANSYGRAGDVALTTKNSAAQSPSTVSDADLSRFQALVERRLGLRLAESELGRLRQLLRTRMVARGQSVTEYLERAERDPSAELASWARELTVTETYFLRHLDQFNALTGEVLRARRQAGRDPARLNLLSAGCATGEEAYSLAIALRQDNPAAQPVILGIDLNASSVDYARRAHYTPWSLRTVPDDLRDRWFIIENGQVTLDPAILGQVQFRQHNLVLDDAEIWRPGAYDVVFCRNVLMYLKPAVMEEVVQRIARALMPGGFLFLGSAETLRGLPTAFTLRESHGAFYYQLGERPPADPAVSIARPLPTPAATERFSAPAVITSLRTAPGELSLTGRYADVLDLLRRERFADALTRLDDMDDAGEGGDRARDDPQSMLLRAALLTHSGSLDDAEATCRSLLEADPASAGAHLLLGIVHECAADDETAFTHCQAAARLDPQFAMPQVHLGRIASRTGRRSSARRHLSTAIELLPAETPLRMLLFSGGFQREALVSLCRTQLAALLEPTTES